MSDTHADAPDAMPPRKLSERVAAVSLTSLPPTRLDVFSDPVAYDSLRDAFLPKNIAALIAMCAFASALAFATNRFVTGDWSTLGVWGVVAAMSTLAVAAALTVATRRPLVLRQRERFWRLLTAQGAATLTWLYIVGLLVDDFFSILGLAALVALVFNDTRYLYDDRILRRQYLVPAVVVDVALGLLWLLRPEAAARIVPTRGGLLVFGAVQLGLVVLTQGLIVTVGQQNRDRDLRAREMQDLTRQLAVYRKEREVLERAARLMTSGLSSVKFAHDVASPISALTMAVEGARVSVARLGPDGPADPQAREDLVEILDIAQAACDRMRAMADTHATALKRRDPVEPVEIGALIARAWKEALATLDTHGARGVVEPSIELAPSPVYVTAGHASTFANLLTNGALQAPDRPLEVRGTVCDAWFYRVTIRDRGVAAGLRPQTIARIERALSLDDDRPEGDAPKRYRGYGIALSIGRVLAVRYNGWLSVREPEEGDGVEFCVVLPRVAPEEIPHEANEPEQYAN